MHPSVDDQVVDDNTQVAYAGMKRHREEPTNYNNRDSCDSDYVADDLNSIMAKPMSAYASPTTSTTMSTPTSHSFINDNIYQQQQHYYQQQQPYQQPQQQPQQQEPQPLRRYQRRSAIVGQMFHDNSIIEHAPKPIPYSTFSTPPPSQTTTPTQLIQPQGNQMNPTKIRRITIEKYPPGI